MNPKTQTTQSRPRGLSHKQKAAIHMAAADAGFTLKTQTPLYRQFLKTHAGVSSAAASRFTRDGFHRVMAAFERIAEKNHSGLRRSQRGYWQAQETSSTQHATQIHAIRQLAADLAWDAASLDGFVRRQTQGRYQSLGEMPGHYLTSIREGLQAIANRKGDHDDQRTQPSSTDIPF